jgi:hypothetical protein
LCIHYTFIMKSLHSVLFFIPEEIPLHNIGIGILCIILAFSLVALYRRIQHGGSSLLFSGSNVEGMTTQSSPLSELQSHADALQTTYDNMKSTADDQKNRIDANAHTLMKIMSDPNQSSNITHVNINTDDPSQTKIPSIDMS